MDNPENQDMEDEDMEIVGQLAQMPEFLQV